MKETTQVLEPILLMNDRCERPIIEMNEKRNIIDACVAVLSRRNGIDNSLPKGLDLDVEVEAFR
jgi:hypothetical protein